MLPVGTPIARVYPRSGSYPARWNEFRNWGPTQSRFDHHPEPTGPHPHYGIIYGAVAGVDVHGVPYPALSTALAEYYQKTRTIAPRPTFDWVAQFATVRSIRLLDLGDSAWLTVVGGNGAINTGPHMQSRKWAREIHPKYPDIW